MIELPPLQHWLVTVVRNAGLPGSDTLSISSDTDTAEAWSLAAMATSIKAGTLAELVAVHYRLGRVDFAQTNLSAIPLLPPDVAHRLGVLCVACTDRVVTVATFDPVSLEAEREIGRMTSRTAHFVIATPEQIEDATKAAYPDRGTGDIHVLPALLAGEESPHVLVVDDDADTRVLLRTVLQGKGFRVSEAADGPEALKLLEGPDAVHLVTLDLNMGEMHGLDVLKRIRQRIRTQALPVVVATGTDDPDVEMELFAAGADDFIVKPIDPPRFLLRVQAVLRRHDRSGHPLLG